MCPALPGLHVTGHRLRGVARPSELPELDGQLVLDPPVVAAAVGGLRTAVADHVSGLLVHGHDHALHGQVYFLRRGRDDAQIGLMRNEQVDVIHGHSSHHVKGIEIYNQRPILYGCGDLLSDYEGISGHEEFRGELGLMYFLSLAPETGRLQRFEMTPTRLQRLRINRASRQEASWLAGVLNREGRSLGSRAVLGEDSRLALQWDTA